MSRPFSSLKFCLGLPKTLRRQNRLLRPPGATNELSRSVREVRELASATTGAKPVRLEIILTVTPRPGDPAWQNELTRIAPGLVVEGRLGSIVTVIADPRSARDLARLPSVSAIRLPRGNSFASQASSDSKSSWDALRATGLDQLRARGGRGQGIRLAVIDGDFRGYEKFLGRGLPPATRCVDLTSERNPSLEPDPFPSPPDAAGHGTRCALAAAVAAPEAQITLIRVDPNAPHQVQEVASFIYGQPVRSFSAAHRSEELLLDMERLQASRQGAHPSPARVS